MSKSGSPGRPDRLGSPGPGYSGAEPGQYDSGPQYDWSNKSKGFTIGERRPQKGEYDNRDYMPDRSDAITKPRAPNTVDMGRDGSPGRGEFAKQSPGHSGAEPGQYDSGLQYDWGYKSKGFTIGERRP